jgi:hypothetical protein
MPDGKSKQSGTKSETTVAARNELNQASGENNDPTSRLEDQAKEQEKLQADLLAKGAKAPADPAQESDVPAAKRTGREDEKTVNGFVDQMSRQDGSQPFEGHFVSVDLNGDGVKEAYEAAGLVDDDDNFVAGDYGVYIEPATLDKETGLPVTGVVRLRDATNARVVVPYAALRPAEARGR